MKLVKVKDYQEMSEKAARIIMDQVKEKPNALLGLATGETVIGTYEIIVKNFKKEQLSFKQISTVNLDEYVGVERSNPTSYYYFMNERLFKHIDIQDDHVHIPNGTEADLQVMCDNYEGIIESLGGVDLQLLGIGHNGHIGFNEPGTSFQTKTHVVELAESTREANARFFKTLEEVPTHAITMGIETITKSRNILLLVSGKDKAPIMERLINGEGEVVESIPASILKLHPSVTIVADEDALSLLENDKMKVLSHD